MTAPQDYDLSALGSVPQITARILAAMGDPRCDADDLSEVLSHDPALVAVILKRVNSAYHHRVKRIESVTQAIVLLGFDAVRELALAAGLRPMFGPERICPGLTLKDLWIHCAEVAVVSRELARLVQPQAAGQAFLAGLLHDIGLLAETRLMRDYLAEACQVAQRDSIPLVDAERRVLKVDHPQIGAALAARWGFPDYCADAIASHHDPAGACDEHAMTTSIVHAADVLCCRGGNGMRLTAMGQEIAPVVAGRIRAEAITKVHQELSAILWSTSTIFQ